MRDAQEAALQPEKPLLFGYRTLYGDKICRKCAKIGEMLALRPSFCQFSHIFSIYKPYGPENSQEFQQWGPTYDPQLVGYAHHLARYTPIWYCPWVAVDP